MRRAAFAALATVLVACAQARADVARDSLPFPPDRELAQQRNNAAPWLVRVEVDRADRVYEEGERLTIRVRSDRPGYLYVVDCYGSDRQGRPDRALLLFPNAFQTDNRIAAGQVVALPPPDAEYDLPATPPFGHERIKALVSLRPIDQWERVRREQEGVFAEVPDRPPAVGDAASWAEDAVDVRLVERGWRAAHASPPRRVGAFIGLKKFADARVPPLSVADRDAIELEQWMKRVGRLDATYRLVNEEATRANVEELICVELAQRTRPGDTVFLFWSGHGGRCPDTGGDEGDGYDEYLVPYDVDLARIAETVILDDTLGHWLQSLDGRTIVILLDACYSGGEATAEKRIKSLLPALPAEQAAGLDFIDGELQRVKDIGQRGTALLAACRAGETALEAPEHGLSVMTFYLIDCLREARGPVNLNAAFEHVYRGVLQYTGDGSRHRQTPLLVSDITGEVWLRPGDSDGEQ